VAVLGAIALSYGIPLGAEGGGQALHVTDAGPFAVLFYVMGGLMLVAALIYVLMPHKALRGRPQAPSPE